MGAEHLKKELEWFLAHRAELVKKHSGKWIVVHEQKQIGIYDTMQEAYDQGVVTTKSTKLLIRQITEADKPIDVSINLRLGLFHAPLYS